MKDYNLITKAVNESLKELIDVAHLRPRNIIIIGCSTSEVAGKKIGTDSNIKIAAALIEGISPVIEDNKLFLAIQCCEHLNRALVVEERCAEQYNLEKVLVYPKSKAGGSMAEIAMSTFENPVVVESIKCHAGLDIGDTFIGMHLKEVAVPVRLSCKNIGKAQLTSAYTRLKLIGGERAEYTKE